MRGRPGLRSIVVDCAEPAALARFWAQALGWQVRPYAPEDIEWLAEQGLTPESDPSVCVDPPDASLPTLWFNSVPEPKVGKVRIHLDVNVPDAAGIGRLEGLGAHIVESHPGGERWTIMADPEGNEFCVFPIDTDE
jgi:catechol 2,3-dioxygenase-like lactoylglutathione lyase family enzyme